MERPVHCFRSLVSPSGSESGSELRKSCTTYHLTEAVLSARWRGIYEQNETEQVKGTVHRDSNMAPRIFCTNLECYRGVLREAQRQLSALSFFEKGKINSENLVNLCCAIQMEAIRRHHLMQYDNAFLKDIRLRPPK